MPTIAVYPIDAERAALTLQQARDNFDMTSGEVILDFSSVRRIDPNALRALEELAVTAKDKSVKVMLRGVNIDVYKVLKLVKLAPRFSFLS